MGLDPKAVGMCWGLVRTRDVGYIIPDLERETSNHINQLYQLQCVVESYPHHSPISREKQVITSINCTDCNVLSSLIHTIPSMSANSCYVIEDLVVNTFENAHQMRDTSTPNRSCLRAR